MAGPIRAALCLALPILFAGPLLAEEVTTAASDGDFECRASAGTVQISHGTGDAGGKWSAPLPAGAWDTGGLRCEAWNDGGVRLVVPGESGRSYEVFAGVDGKGIPAPAWEGVTGLEGEFGERWGWFLDWEPVAPGSGDVVPILYALHEQVTVCGYGMVPIAVKRFDPATGSFRPISFDRLKRAGTGWGGGAAPSAADPSVKAVTLMAKLSPAKDPPPGPPAISGFLRFESSSSYLGDGGDPASARSPLELGDGKAETGWTEGVGGPGWGEFVTARTGSGEIGLTTLTIAATKGNDAAAASAWNRIKEIELVMSGGKRFVVKIPSDPLKNPSRPVVIGFPEPVTSECVSVIVRDVYPAKGKGSDSTYVGEITAYTGVDTDEGLIEMLGWFEDDAKAGEAARIVGDLDVAAALRAAAGWEALGPGARRGVVAAIDVGWLAALEPLVEKAAASAEAAEDADLFSLLVDRLVMVAGGAPLFDMLRSWAAPEADPAVANVAISVLARLGRVVGPLAATWLDHSWTAGEGAWEPWGDVDVTAWLKQGLVLANEEGYQQIDDLLEAKLASVVDGEVLRRAIIILYLLDYKDEDIPWSKLAAEWAGRLWDEIPTLYCRWHLLPVAGKLIALGDPAGMEIAHRALADPDAEPGLRVAAMKTACRAKGDLLEVAAAESLAALSDPWPAVRATAASCLAKQASLDDDSAEEILKVAASDPWPEVRVEALRAASWIDDLPIEAAYAFLKDPDSSARKEAIRLVIAKGLGTEEVGILLANTTIAGGMRSDVRVDAAHAIGKLCILQMAVPLENVVMLGLAPDASEGSIMAAAAAAEALGMLGDPGALEVLMEATSPGLRFEIRIAAIEALGRIGDPAASKLVASLASHPEPSIAIAAKMALASLSAGKPAAKCAPSD